MGSHAILTTWGAGKRYASNIIANQTILYWKELFFATLTANLYTSIALSFGIAAVIIFYFAYRGSAPTRKRHVSDNRMVLKWKLIRAVKRYNRKAIGIFNRLNPLFINNSYKIAGVPYPYGSESTHTLIVGATGTGKTAAIRDLVRQIRANGDRAIIFDDRMCTFTGSFYKQQSDILLNPLDGRCPKWNLFQEVQAQG